VVRTFPGVDFFRKDMIQDAMVNILFCYARENPAMCYRQVRVSYKTGLAYEYLCTKVIIPVCRYGRSCNFIIFFFRDP
jgi:hypothetical protein